VAPGDATPETLSFEAAAARVRAAVSPLPTERIEVAEAAGRALAREVRAAHPLPPFANSAMDGIAARAADLAVASTAAPAILRVVATIAAGHPATRPLAAGEAMRIMTGAPIPDGADTIVPVEDLAFDGDGVRVTAPAPPGAFVRGAGLDLAAGAVALERGRTLSPHDLAVLASLGVDEVEVGRRPRVAIVSTGDELVAPDARLVPGAIRDGNTPMLAALVAEAGGFVVGTTRLRDDPLAVSEAVRTGLAEADVVLTIGGVSEGAFDPVKEAIASIGGIALWRVAMKPGRPQAFGAPAGRLFFGLPGNPASVACVFEALVRPALRMLQGHADPDRPRIPVRTATAIASRAGRTDFVRVTLEPGDPLPLAREAGAGVSGHLMPQSRAHGLLVVPADVATLPAGARADVWLWRWPGAPAA